MWIRKVARAAPAKWDISFFFVLILLLCQGRAWGISDVCQDQCTSLRDGGLFVCGRNCDVDLDDEARDDPAFEALTREYAHLPVGLYFLNLKIRTRLLPPVIERVDVSSEQPEPGGVVKIDVTLPPGEEGVPPPEITAFYSYDAAATWHADTATPGSGQNTAAVFIPVPSDAENIRWFLRARDADGNEYIEIPCAVAHFPFEPGECLVPLAADTNYSEYENFTADPAADIVRSRMGEDEKNYYFEITAAAPVSPGELQPLGINMYVAAVYDPGELVRSEPMTNVRFIAYAPLYYTPADCALISRKGAEWIAETASVDCRAIGDTIQIRVPKVFVNPNRRDTLHVFFATIRIVEDHMRGVREFNNISSFIQKSVIVDYTGATAVTPITRELIISRDE